MSTLVRATVPNEEFLLAETFARVPAVEVDALRLIGDGNRRGLPLLWARGADAPVVHDALESDETTGSVDLVSRRDRDSLFRIRWTDSARSLTDVISDAGGAVVSVHGTREGWWFRLLFPDHDAVSGTYDACAEYDVSFERIQSLVEASVDPVQLTETQARTLETALESGYYGIPRDVTIEPLATELGVSHQALSERLRRAHRTLVETVLGL